MSDALPISAALARNLAGRSWRDDALSHDFETGKAITRKANAGFSSAFQRQRAFKPVVDPRSQLAERRRWAGWGILPNHMRHLFTAGETAVLAIVAREVKRHGYCDLCYDRIAMDAGVCKTIVKNTFRQARKNGLVDVQQRPVPGRKNLTNLIRIVSKEWTAWLVRSGIGGRKMPAYKNQDKNNSQSKEITVTQQACALVVKPEKGLWRGSGRDQRCERPPFSYAGGVRHG